MPTLEAIQQRKKLVSVVVKSRLPNHLNTRSMRIVLYSFLQPGNTNHHHKTSCMHTCIVVQLINTSIHLFNWAFFFLLFLGFGGGLGRGGWNKHKLNSSLPTRKINMHLFQLLHIHNVSHPSEHRCQGSRIATLKLTTEPILHGNDLGFENGNISKMGKPQSPSHF